MREIDFDFIVEMVAKMCAEANLTLPCDVENSLINSLEKESSPLAKDALEKALKNLKIARENKLPICQDTGLVTVFCEIGEEVKICDGLLNDAINKGIATGYTNGNLRCSVVQDPLNRTNTNDNTPAIIHTKIVAGDKLKLTLMPKGAGAENMSNIYMLAPTVAREEIVKKVVECVEAAGGCPCPPVVVGVGIGGNFEYAAFLAKKALLRAINVPNEDEYYKKLENDMLIAINKTNIGAQGFGGNITALGVNIEHFATHIAMLPLAVNISCHISRHQTIEI